MTTKEAISTISTAYNMIKYKNVYQKMKERN